MRLTLFWEGVAGSREPLTGFVHLRNNVPEGPINPQTGSDIWAQTTHEGISRELAPGKLFMEEYRLPIPADTPPGQYFLETGWFDPATGEQLDVDPASLGQPLRILWRSVLLPDVTIR